MSNLREIEASVASLDRDFDLMEEIYEFKMEPGERRRVLRVVQEHLQSIVTGLGPILQGHDTDYHLLRDLIPKANELRMEFEHEAAYHVHCCIVSTLGCS